MIEKQIFEYLDARRGEMQAVLDFMETHPATGYREWEASNYLAEAYKKLGYTLTTAGDIPGFYTDVDTGNPGPKILILSELDGLLVPGHPHADPETNAAHACGHHAQCAALYGVAAALREPAVLKGLCGSIRLCVVPAEELVEIEFRAELRRKGIIRYFGGKQEFLARGYFDGCDMAFMIHTGGGQHKFSIRPGCNGCIIKTAEFTGKAVHAAAPRHGINALQAASLSLSAINALRDTFNNYDFIRVHPILTQAGTAVNAVPGVCVMENQVRANDAEICKNINRKVNRAVAASAAAIGAKVRLYDVPGYLPGAYDKTLTDVMIDAMAEVVGRENVKYMQIPWDTGCSDMGDLSLVMPAVHAFGSGGAGAAHGPTYHIADFDSACMDSAKAQIAIIRALLENGANKANAVLEHAKPYFATRKDYTDYLDSLFLDTDAVEYSENGDVVLHL